MSDQSSIRVENLRTAFTRAAAKDAQVDALKQERRLIDAANMEKPRDAAVIHFFREFAKLVKDTPEFWERMK